MADAARLLLTRPLAQAQDWSERLATLGVPTLAFPLIDIAPTSDPEPARRAWDGLQAQRLVMFVSPNAVHHFFEHRPAGRAWPASVLAATVGPGSARALALAGVPEQNIVQPPQEAESLDSEHLWPEIQRLAGTDWTGRSALLVRGDGGREWLGDRLREAGAAVSTISVYRRQCPVLDAGARGRLRAVLERPELHVWLFSSSEAVGHLETLAAELLHEGAGLPASPECGTATPLDWSRLHALATHARIAARARSLGLSHVVLVRPDAAAVAQAFHQLAGTPLESPT